MRETTFLKQNEKKWKEFERLVHAPKKSIAPDEVAELFIQVTDDLSYARTHFPNSKSVSYLNGLAAQVHMSILKNKRTKQASLVDFVRVELPLLMAAHRLKLYFAFAVFVLAIVIGAVSTYADENFIRLILSDEYVDMTIRNMERGQPLAVYGGDGEISSFLGITVNNVRVSFIAFVGGLFLSLGTLYMLLSNGIMVGTFFAFLFKYGFGKEAMLTVMIHGTLELSAIVIAGMAGFCLGHSILFPRTYSRMESLRRGATDGLKIVLGLVPVFVVAGFLEGFVTRHTDMPALLSLTIIIVSLGFIVYYFVVFPLLLQSRTSGQSLNENGTGNHPTA
jgi:uncharacterized membrane protein SpoIIM required for sporulation